MTVNHNAHANRMIIKTFHMLKHRSVHCANQPAAMFGLSADSCGESGVSYKGDILSYQDKVTPNSYNFAFVNDFEAGATQPELWFRPTVNQQNQIQKELT